jgi:amino acid transporter
MLNRVSENGVLTDWFRHPYPHYGTWHRIINMVVALQPVVIVVSRGGIIFLGNLYAFRVVWSFAMKGLAVLVLRYTQPERQRDFRVPLNVRIGLGRITLVPISIAVVNLLTKHDATVSGIVFSLVCSLSRGLGAHNSQARFPPQGA